jgi:ABC-2 type transport system permease protein
MQRNIRLVARRELASYFDSPVAYIVLVSFLLAAGWMFFSTLFLMGRADMRGFFTPSPFSPSMLLVILAPAVTMRLLAEEKRSGTFELMATLPIRDSEWVLGKFLAAWALLGIGLSTTLVYALSVSALGELDWGPVLSGYLGFLLFSGSLLSLGLLCSALTDKQIIAFIVSFLLSAALYFVFWLQFFVPQAIAPVLEYVSVAYHLDNLARGVVDSRDLLFYLSLMAGCLFLTVRSVSRQHA